MFNARELVPDYWRIEPSTTDDIIFAGRENIERMIGSWRSKSERSRSEMIRALDKASTLEKLFVFSKAKPIFAGHRPHDYFNVGDRVMVYIANWDNRIVDKHWAAGEVIISYRHHDGCVSFRLDERVSSGDCLDGHGGSSGLAHPSVVKEWEYNYLRNHTDFAEYWATYGVSRYIKEFKMNEYLASLKGDK